MLGSIGVTLIMIEILLRVAIAFNLGGLRNADLFYNSLSDDNYWKYRLIWSDYEETVMRTLQPDFGWLPPTSPTNPHGIVLSDAGNSKPIDTSGPAVLFYGDSYVQALTPPADAIPQQMDLLLPDENVYNLGVSGFGIGQIYLRLRQTSADFEDPTLLFGMLSFDLDRTVLNVRSAPKPRVSFDEAGQLQVANTPFNQDVEAWMADHPPRTLSFLWALINRTTNLIQSANNGSAFGHETRVDEKIAVNGQIMDHAANFAAENNQPLIFVTFYSLSEFENDSWRETFFDEMCKKHDCINTQPALTAQAQAQNRPVSDFYLADGLHLNAEGNKIVAQYIVSEMEKR